jgi:hypothetical protein
MSLQSALHIDGVKVDGTPLIGVGRVEEPPE